MVTSKDIKWGKYKTYEGPYYPGVERFKLPADPSFSDKILAVLTATEGGTFDAINMYDRCGISGGLIQLCEFGQYSLSGLLGAIVDGAALPDNSQFSELLAEQGYIFTNLIKGKYRFYKAKPKKGEFDEVDTIKEQQDLLLKCDGKIGSWGPSEKEHAKRWAAAVAEVLAEEKAKPIQVKYVADRMPSFMLGTGRATFPRHEENDHNPWYNVAYAGFLSFAGNNPRWAEETLVKFLKEYPLAPAAGGFGKMWDEWSVVALFKALTFEKQITIYPKRYESIRPVLEKLWEVDLPDLSDELEDTSVMDARTVQTYLIRFGYDLGPSGADNWWGKLSKEAMEDFQRLHNLPITGYPDSQSFSLLTGVASFDVEENNPDPTEVPPDSKKTLPSPPMTEEREGSGWIWVESPLIEEILVGTPEHEAREEIQEKDEGVNPMGASKSRRGRRGRRGK